MGQYNSINTWTYNCGKEDLDYRAIWDDSGSLIVHVPYLIMIRFTMWSWNSRDGWSQQGPREKVLSEPTSQPHTFSEVSLARAIGGANTAHLYWNRKYRIDTEIEIISDKNGMISIQDHYTSIEGCFYHGDPNYEDVFDCIPGGEEKE